MKTSAGRSATALGSPARLWENIASLSTLHVVNCVVPLVTVPYLVRVLGAANFGLLSFAQALIIYFDLVTDYGFNLSATRAVAARRNEPDALAQTFWRTLSAKTALMIVSALVLSALVAAIPRLRETSLLYAAAFLTVVGTVACPVWFFQGIEQMKFLTIAQSSSRLLTLPALIVLVQRPDDYVRAAAIQGSVPVFAGLLLALVLWKKVPYGPHLSHVAGIPSALRDGWNLFIANTALAINASTTTVVLGVVAGNAAVGYYGAADKVVRAVGSLLAPVTQALYPHLNSLKARSAEMALRFMRKSFAWIVLLAAAASLATFLFSGPVGLLLWGREFIPSIAVLRCLSPLPLLLALINIIGAQTMLVFEMDALVSRVFMLCAAINVPLTAILSIRIGALGAAAAAVATALLMALSLAWSLRRQRLAIWRALSERTCVP
jgi:PST family polysaccharide transporter